MDSPTFVPTVKVGKVLEDGDSIQYMEMNNVYVFPPVTFSSKKQQGAYMRLVKNVKTVLPIAKEARMIMMETAAYLETLPSKQGQGGTHDHDGDGGIPGDAAHQAGPRGTHEACGEECHAGV